MPFPDISQTPIGDKTIICYLRFSLMKIHRLEPQCSLSLGIWLWTAVVKSLKQGQYNVTGSHGDQEKWHREMFSNLLFVTKRCPLTERLK